MLVTVTQTSATETISGLLIDTFLEIFPFNPLTYAADESFDAPGERSIVWIHGQT